MTIHRTPCWPVAFAFACAALFAGACTDGADDTSGADGGGSLTPTLVDANNYAFSGAMTIATDEFTALEDATVDWSGATEDLQGHAFDPATDVDQVELIALRDLSHEEVAQALESDTLVQADISLFLQFINSEEATNCMLSDLTLFGNDIGVVDYLEEDSGTWMLLLAQGTTPGQGTLLIRFIVPRVGIDDHEITFDNHSTELAVEVDLRSLEPVAVPASEAAVAVDWSQLTLDARGNEFDLGSIDELWVAHYPDLGVSDLEDQFLDLELISGELWTYEPAGATDAVLTDLAGDTPFEGFTKDGTWLLALRCSTCVNPAPPFMTVIDVR